MRKHFRFFPAFLAGIMLVMLLAGCSDHTSSEPDTLGDSQSENTAPAEPDTQPDALAPSDGKQISSTLVVYFSATGSTEAVANTIADTTGGDIFVLVPVEPYSSDDLNWRNTDSRVSVEHDNPDQRNVELVAETVENWDSYDTIFIGYPIWWGIAAWPVDTFIKANDFTGKTVIPFCTSSSSGLGESAELLAEMAETGDWWEGQRFQSSVSASDVTDWVNNLGLDFSSK